MVHRRHRDRALTDAQGAVVLGDQVVAVGQCRCVDGVAANTAATGCRCAQGAAQTVGVDQAPTGAGAIGRYRVGQRRIGVAIALCLAISRHRQGSLADRAGGVVGLRYRVVGAAVAVAHADGGNRHGLVGRAGIGVAEGKGAAAQAVQRVAVAGVGVERAAGDGRSSRRSQAAVIGLGDGGGADGQRGFIDGRADRTTGQRVIAVIQGQRAAAKAVVAGGIGAGYAGAAGHRWL